MMFPHILRLKNPTYFVCKILSFWEHLILARHNVCSGRSHENDVEITTDSQSPEVAKLCWAGAADRWDVWFGLIQGWN